MFGVTCSEEEWRAGEEENEGSTEEPHASQGGHFNSGIQTTTFNFWSNSYRSSYYWVKLFLWFVSE